MTVELVTGHAGRAHVSSADAGMYNALTVGTGSYCLGDEPTLSMLDANTLSISPCNLLLSGRHVILSGTNSVVIESGAQTGSRIDRVYVRYARDSSGVETATLGVKKGATVTSGTPTAPDLDETGSVLEGAQAEDFEIARVSLDALTPTATWTLESMGTMSSLWGALSDLQDSVSHSLTPSTIAVGGSATIVGIWRGAKTIKLSGQFNSLLTDADLRSLTGHSLSDGSWSGFCFWPNWGQAKHGAPALGFSSSAINVYLQNGESGASVTVGFVLVLTE